ncbi:MAG: DEAD/DEAH box helicase [Acidobacteriota bacterium]|jgi:ATP-dependent RNA helicase RhlB|nr:DEAD/DEAH box helicase [Acidobacteriota bacterium]
MKFAELKLDKDLLKGIEETGFEECLPVQAATLPLTLEGKDVTVQSQTGTGKTAAFLITIFQRLTHDSSVKGKKALIVVPTRELAVQIEKNAAEIGARMDFVIGCFYGGVGYQQQESLIRRNVNVIIGTPGRLLDLNGSGKLSFRDVAILVIDEADRLFDMGFLPDIRRMMRRMMPPRQRQTMLFSATLGYEARSISREFMNQPEKVEIQPEQVTVDKITQVIYHVGHREKIPLLLGLLKRDRPANTLIFTNTKHMAEKVDFHLRANGYASEFLMGDLPQKKRLRIISDFKAGRIPILVATDVAARGLHIEDLDLVVNYDLPGDCENYVHRIGRTARAGKSGKAISLACDDFIFNLDAIEKFIGMRIPTAAVDAELLVASKVSDYDFRMRGRGNGPAPESFADRGRSRSNGPRSSRNSQGKRPLRPRGENRASGKTDPAATGRSRKPSGKAPVNTAAAGSSPQRAANSARSRTTSRDGGSENRARKPHPRQADSMKRQHQSQTQADMPTPPASLAPESKDKTGRINRLLGRLKKGLRGS